MGTFLFSGPGGRSAGRIRAAGLAWPLFALLACTPGPDAELSLEDGWVRAMPAAATMSAGYGTLHWRGSERLVITGWRSANFGAVSLHRTIVRDGVSRMEAVTDAAIEPGDELALEPGGLHLMLMGPIRELRVGDTVSITLLSDSGRSFRFDFPVLAH
jgi:copper(I)-binding protein